MLRKMVMGWVMLLFPVLLSAQDMNAGQPGTPAGAGRDTATIDTTNMPPQGVYKRETIPEKTTPIPYAYVREADVLWSKIIWRTVDLRQKINLPLYYPTNPMKDRKSLTQCLVAAVMDGEISAYDPTRSMTYPGDEFVARMTPAQVMEKLGAKTEVRQQTSITTGADTTIVIQSEANYAEIRELNIKEEWFFDSKSSRLQVRIIGLCPVRVFEDELTHKIQKAMVFWVYYPECRKVLSRTAAYNPKNDAQVVSYDDLFFMRRFDSYISRESNEYDNRAISEYKKDGVSQMRESDRVKNTLFVQEHDLWEY